MKLINWLLRHANVIIVIALFSFVAGTLFFYAFPFNVAKLNKITILNEVKAGSLIEYKVNFCRYVEKGTEVEVRRFIIPKNSSLTNPQELDSSPSLETLDDITGCRDSETIKLPIDIAAPEGEYKLLIRAKYCLNVTVFRRCIPVEQYSDYFTIGKPSIPSQLSVINQQLEQINRYYLQNPGETSIGNTQQSQPLPEPNRPNMANPSTSTAEPVQTPPETSQGIVQRLTQTTSGLVRNVTQLLVGE